MDGGTLESSTAKLAVKIPNASGVPLMTPAVSMDTPGGRGSTVQMNGAIPPVAVIWKVPPSACTTDLPTNSVGRVAVEMATGGVSVCAVAVNWYGGTTSSLARGRPSIGNTSTAIVPNSELALSKRVEATRSLSSDVTVSRTRQRARTSHGLGVDAPVLAVVISKVC